MVPYSEKEPSRSYYTRGKSDILEVRARNSADANQHSGKRRKKYSPTKGRGGAGLGFPVVTVCFFFGRFFRALKEDLERKAGVLDLHV